MYPFFKTVKAVNTATSASSQAIAIPTDSTGKPARRVSVSASQATYILPGYSTTTVSTSNGIVVSTAGPVHLDVGGLTHIAILQVQSTGQLSIAVVED